MQLVCGGLDRTAVLRKIVSATGLCLVVALVQPAGGQSASVPADRYSVSVFAAGASGSALPFWLSANRYGVVDPGSANGGARVRAWRRTPDSPGLRLGYGLDVIGRASQHETAYAHELYGRLRYRPLQVTVGRREQQIGRVDTRLSMGSTTWSRNATPPPKLSISSTGYVDVPGTNGTLALNGYMAHGWLGTDRYVRDALLHEKYLYLRLLPASSAVNGHAGIIHHAVWGGTHPTAGAQARSFAEWVDVALGSDVLTSDRDAAQSDRSNANHIAAYDFRIDVQIGSIDASVYRQFYHEDVASFRFRNVWDGLWGVRLHRTGSSGLVDAILWEHLRMTRQSAKFAEGESRGTDSYYNHVHYRSGWTYEGRTLGIPLLTAASATPGLDDGTPGVGNNIVVAQHVGLSGAFGSRLSYRLLGTYSRNYGAKRVCASPSCTSFTDRRTARRDQWSMRLAVNGVLLPEYGLQFRAAAAVDVGEYFDDRAGGSLALIWRGAWGR